VNAVITNFNTNNETNEMVKTSPKKK